MNDDISVCVSNIHRILFFSLSHYSGKTQPQQLYWKFVHLLVHPFMQITVKRFFVGWELMPWVQKMEQDWTQAQYCVHKWKWNKYCVPLKSILTLILNNWQSIIKSEHVYVDKLWMILWPFFPQYKFTNN